MLNGVLVPLLCLSLRCNSDPGFGKRFLPTGWHFSLEIRQVPRRINIRVTCSTSELRLYFKSNLKTWLRKLRVNSVSRAYFVCLRRRSRLRRAQLKLFSSGRTFRLSLVPQPIESISVNESWKFEYDKTNKWLFNQKSMKVILLFNSNFILEFKKTFFVHFAEWIQICKELLLELFWGLLRVINKIKIFDQTFSGISQIKAKLF